MSLPTLQAGREPGLYVCLVTPAYFVLMIFSTGNHAQAVAWACKMKGIRAHIIMPRNAPLIKIAAVKGYGAKVYFCEPTLEARETTAKEVLEVTGGAFLHPFDNVDVINGQGSVGIELLKQVQEEHGAPLDALIVPVGGGGLISGIATAAKGLRPDILVIGAEPALADDAARSKASGIHCGHVTPPKTIADGLLTTTGALTLPIILSKVDKIITVSEAEIARGMRLIYERAKMVIEPSAGVGVAVALSKKLQEYLPDHMENIGVVLCGGNLDLGRLAEIWKLADEVDEEGKAAVTEDPPPGPST